MHIASRVSFLSSLWYHNTGCFLFRLFHKTSGNFFIFFFGFVFIFFIISLDNIKMTWWNCFFLCYFNFCIFFVTRQIIKINLNILLGLMTKFFFGFNSLKLKFYFIKVISLKFVKILNFKRKQHGGSSVIYKNRLEIN